MVSILAQRILDPEPDSSPPICRQLTFKVNFSNNLKSVGAKPRVWAKPEVNKPYFQDVSDIAGSGPRQLHFGLNKPETNLSNADIPKSQPQCIKFTTTRQPSNPLNPVYKLQSFEYVPPPCVHSVFPGIYVSERHLLGHDPQSHVCANASGQCSNV